MRITTFRDVDNIHYFHSLNSFIVWPVSLYLLRAMRLLFFYLHWLPEWRRRGQGFRTAKTQPCFCMHVVLIQLNEATGQIKKM